MTLLETKIPDIYSALIKVMQTVGAITKDQKNQAQGFRFRGVDQVMNALQPALIEHGVLIIPAVIDKDIELRTNAKGTQMTFMRLTMEYRFIAASDGSSVTATVLGEAQDSGDKCASKAMSIAYKYACFQVLSIPTEDTANDPDKEVHETTSSTPVSRTSSNGLPFKSPQQAYEWCADLLQIPQAEAEKLFAQTEPNEEGKKAAPFYQKVMRMVTAGKAAA